MVVPEAPLPGTGGFRAGAAEADVTPAMLVGTFGHGPEARQALGRRGRLRCRAVYLEDAQGERVAFVACDLLGISLALVREVGARLPSELHLGADRLVISATHTHGGPAHYFASPNYAGAFSGETTGFDPRVLDFLATRIAGAIARAAETAQPARIAWTHAFVNGGRDREPAIGQNRSVVAHCGNEDPMGELGTTCRTDGVDPVAEVEGRLDLLRIDVEGPEGPRPLALYASFPVHGTVVPNTNQLLEADLFGYAARRIEARLRGDGSFVAVLANGAEGDVRPDYRVQGWPEARRLGELLADRVVAAHGGASAYETEPRIVRAMRDLFLPNALAPEDGADAPRLCPHAALGRAAICGSEEGRTHFCGRLFHEGIVSPGTGCQAPKAFLISENLGAGGFPTVAPLSVVGVGSGAIVSYPFEATTTAGRRIRASVAAALGTEQVMLVGLANEYVQYMTTPEEYAAQHYEGGSTLYGPRTQPVITAHLVRLARSVRAGVEGSGRPLVEPLALPEVRLDRADVMPDEPPLVPVLERTSSTTRDDRQAFVLFFRAGHPVTLVGTGQPFVRVERRDAEGRFVPHVDAAGDPVDDTSEDVELVHEGKKSGRRGIHRYRATWMPSAETPPGTYRLVLIVDAVHSVPGTPFPYVGD
ncbi:MAG: neutral/alkaline non-lysosomal ceramidase N-terminal domain-containing protein [Polyangiales bacterium]